MAIWDRRAILHLSAKHLQLLSIRSKASFGRYHRRQFGNRCGCLFQCHARLIGWTVVTS